MALPTDEEMDALMQSCRDTIAIDDRKLEAPATPDNQVANREPPAPSAPAPSAPSSPSYPYDASVAVAKHRPNELKSNSVPRKPDAKWHESCEQVQKVRKLVPKAPNHPPPGVAPSVAPWRAGAGSRILASAESLPHLTLETLAFCDQRKIAPPPKAVLPAALATPPAVAALPAIVPPPPPPAVSAIVPPPPQAYASPPHVAEAGQPKRTRGTDPNSSWHTAWHRAKAKGPEAEALFRSVWPKPQAKAKVGVPVAKHQCEVVLNE